MELADVDFTPLARALSALDEAIAVLHDPPGPQFKQLMQDATIQRFEFTFELAWKMLRRVLMSQGHQDVGASARAIFRMGRQEGFLDDVRTWFGYLEARNVTTHVYDNEKVHDLLHSIESFRDDAYALLQRLSDRCHEPE